MKQFILPIVVRSLFCVVESINEIIVAEVVGFVVDSARESKL